MFFENTSEEHDFVRMRLFWKADHLNQLELCGGRGEDQKFNFRMEGESLQKVFISTNLIDDLD